MTLAAGSKQELKWAVQVTHDPADKGVRWALSFSDGAKGNPKNDFDQNILTGDLGPGGNDPPSILSNMSTTVTIPSSPLKLGQATLQWAWVGGGGQYLNCADVTITNQSIAFEIEYPSVRSISIAVLFIFDHNIALLLLLIATDVVTLIAKKVPCMQSNVNLVKQRLENIATALERTAADGSTPVSSVDEPICTALDDKGVSKAPGTTTTPTPTRRRRDHVGIKAIVRFTGPNDFDSLPSAAFKLPAIDGIEYPAPITSFSVGGTRSSLADPGMSGAEGFFLGALCVYPHFLSFRRLLLTGAIICHLSSQSLFSQLPDHLNASTQKQQHHWVYLRFVRDCL